VPTLVRALLFAFLGTLACTCFVAAQSRAASRGSFADLSARAEASRDANRLREAASLYRKAVSLRPSWKDGWWSLGTVLYDSDSYLQAAEAFRRLLAIDPSNGTAHLMLALCEYELGRDAAAMKDIQSAKRLGIKKDEQLEHVLLYHEALLLLRKGEYENSLVPLGGLVKQGVRSDELVAGLGMAVLRIRPQDILESGPQADQAVRRAGWSEQQSLAKDLGQAREGYASLVREFSVVPNVHYAYGCFLLSIQETEEAIAEFKSELQRDPQHIPAQMQIAATYYRTDSSAGIPYAQAVVKLKPKYPFGHYLLGLLCFDSGNLTQALPELEAAARLVPTEAQFQFALGNAYARAGRREEAARARAQFRRLGGDAESSSGPDAYGAQRPLKLGQTTEGSGKKGPR
jgi:tetratricopeptide (TPR) repeat protein